MTETLKNYIFRFMVVTAVFGFVIVPTAKTFAYTIETIPNGELVVGDFVVGPGKKELEIKPGESETVNMIVTNRMGDDRIFTLEVEDFKGSNDTQATVVLLGDERGPYSLKDYISFSQKSFELKQGQRATVPVTISVPTDAQPGGLYGSVLVSTASKSTSALGPKNTIVSRIGTLFFVKVPGDIKYVGQLKEFSTKGGERIFNSGPINFSLLYENKGSVYVNPYGEIRIKNMLGKDVDIMKIDPWYALPDSTRLREIESSAGFLLGKYTAVASINRGYENIVDTKEFTFWVIPVKLLVLVCVVILFLIFFVRFVITRFEIRKK